MINRIKSMLRSNNVETSSSAPNNSYSFKQYSKGVKCFPWKSVLALAGIALSLIYDVYWIWGIILTYWGVIGIRDGTTYLLDEVKKSDYPKLFWITVLTWLFLGIWSFADALFSIWKAAGRL